LYDLGKFTIFHNNTGKTTIFGILVISNGGQQKYVAHPTWLNGSEARRASWETAEYVKVCPVVWEDGGGNPASYPILAWLKRFGRGYKPRPAEVKP
jgi:hypothetical protein